jgi:hypothetical protein
MACYPSLILVIYTYRALCAVVHQFSFIGHELEDIRSLCYTHGQRLLEDAPAEYYVSAIPPVKTSTTKCFVCLTWMTL